MTQIVQRQAGTVVLKLRSGYTALCALMKRDEGNPESDLPEKKNDGKNGEKVRQFGKKRPND